MSTCLSNEQKQISCLNHKKKTFEIKARLVPLSSDLISLGPDLKWLTSLYKNFPINT